MLQALSLRVPPGQVISAVVARMRAALTQRLPAVARKVSVAGRAVGIHT